MKMKDPMFYGSTWTLPDGKLMLLPIGITVNYASGVRYVSVKTNKGDNHVPRAMYKENLILGIIIGLQTLGEYLSVEGRSPGKFSSTKTKKKFVLINTGKVGVCGYTYLNGRGFRIHSLAVTYPDLKAGRAKVKIRYVGTDSTWKSHYEKVLEEQVQFRHDRMEEYRLEFLNRINQCIETLNHYL